MVQNNSSSESHCSRSVSEICRLFLSLASKRQVKVSQCSDCAEKSVNPAALTNARKTAGKASFWRGNAQKV